MRDCLYNIAVSAREANPTILLAYLGFVAAAAVAVYSFVSIAKDGELRRNCSAMCLMKPAYAGANRKLPSFELADMTGKKVSSDAFRGKVLVLNFWTKTCGPCMQEMPEIAQLAQVVKDRKDVAVVTVSADLGPADVHDTLYTVLRGQDPPFPVLFDPDQKVIGDKFGTKLYPETWIVDPRGIIRARIDGARPWAGSDVMELIDNLSSGGYCPLEVSDGRTTGKAAHLCEEMAGGG